MFRKTTISVAALATRNVPRIQGSNTSTLKNVRCQALFPGDVSGSLGARFINSTAMVCQDSSFIGEQAAVINKRHCKVSIEEAKLMPLEWYEMPNGVLLNAAIEGDPAAREELLRRNIMSVEEISWDDADLILDEMKAENKKFMSVLKLPYTIGITTAFAAGFLSIPLIFHLDSVLWFNEAFVTFEMAGEGELDTPLEVGAYSWNWMEPPLGEASFFLLCMQFARNSMANIGFRPYGDWVKYSRARKLSRKYPRYHAKLVEEFALTHTFG